MDVLTILFAGLITHVLTDGGTQRAVLVAAPMHAARLVVAEADVLSADGFSRDASGAYQLEGEHLMIDGLSADRVTFDASYRRHVPSLLRISDGTRLIDEIHTASPHEAVAAYLDLSGGTFSVNETWDTQVTFGSGNPECLARTVMFRAPSAGDVIFRTASGKSLRVRGNAVVRVMNEPVHEMPGHFHYYGSLFTDSTYVDQPMTTGAACGAERPRGRKRIVTQALSGDCSNTGCCP